MPGSLTECAPAPSKLGKCRSSVRGTSTRGGLANCALPALFPTLPCRRRTIVRRRLALTTDRGLKFRLAAPQDAKLRPELTHPRQRDSAMRLTSAQAAHRQGMPSGLAASGNLLLAGSLIVGAVLLDPICRISDDRDGAPQIYRLFKGGPLSTPS